MPGSPQYLNQEKNETEGICFDKKVWLVIPSFNDSKRLGLFLPKLCQELETSPIAVLVQVVDDGSSPEDQSMLSALITSVREKYPFVQAPMFQGSNQGKGAAILRGWDAGKNMKWYGFLDADGAVPAYEVVRILKLAEHADTKVSYFASRVKMRGRKVNRSLKRHLSGRIFGTLVGGLIDSGIYDSQCGFKLITREAYQKTASILQEKRFSFDVELLAALNHFGCPLEEVPVDWFDVPGSKVSLLSDSLRMLWAVRQIRSRMNAIKLEKPDLFLVD